MTTRQALNFYEYSPCSICRKARQWLDQRGIPYARIPIRETPPTLEELQDMLDALGGRIRKMINTSSQDYREAGLKDRLDNMDPSEVFLLLRKNGNLVKRPFVLGPGVALTGFRPPEWEAAFSNPAP